MLDIFSHAGNRKRIYALSSFTVVYRSTGWWYRKTDTDDEWRGPYYTKTSVCLMLARELKREVMKRDVPRT